MIFNKWKSIIFIFPFVIIYGFLNAATPISDNNNVENTVKRIISSQILAFKQNNLEEAYSFAAPNIKRQFSDADKFGMMVKNGYPVIWEPKSYRFVKFSTNGKRSIQRVIFKSANDALVTYDYLLEKFNSEWTIAGVMLVNTDGNI